MLLRWSVLLGALCAATAAGASAAPPTSIACTGVPVRVEGGSAYEARIACDGAKAAFDFLAPLQLAVPAGVTVRLAPSLPRRVGREAMGCFDRQSGRIVVLRYRQFTRRGHWFGVAPDAALYRSLFTHEVAHAIAAHHAGGLPRVAQEYVGHVTMLSTMQAGLRARLLANHRGDGFEHPSQITELILSVDPRYFALESYLHWLGQPDPPAFLRRVLDGLELQGPGQ